MDKILTIAWREYKAMVGTKTFIVSMIMMPVLMFAGIIAMELFKDVGQSRLRKIAVIDHSNLIFPELLKASSERNIRIEESRNGDKKSESNFPGLTEEQYELEQIDSSSINDSTRFGLSQRVRDQELYAFVEIPKTVLAMKPSQGESIRFYSEDSSISLAKNWLKINISQIAKSHRIKQSGIDAEELTRFEQFSREAMVVGNGLMERSESGKIESSEERNLILSLFLPMGVMLLMFMVIFMSSQPMLESVLEEKSQRIAEVLLGSANPFQLMMGKLIGTVAGSLTIFFIYLIGVYSFSVYRDWTDNIPLEIIPWFIIFQVTGVFFYASIFMSVGASVSQLKEAQSLLLPVWMLLMTPLFVWLMIVRDPQGPLAVGMSFFPPTAPTTTVLRMATGQTIPIWQPIVSLILTIFATILLVILASRIFRVGILWQGKTPKLKEMMHWAIFGE